MKMIGKQLGSYRIEEEVGGGGQATLYRAVHVRLGRPTALKVLHPHLTSEPLFRQKFATESRLLAQLHHPNIVSVFDADHSDGHYWIAMEWLDGQTLGQIIRQNGCLSENTAVEIVKQIAQALQYAHNSHIIHRDVKPANIMVLPNSDVKLLDFGIAAIIAAGEKAKTRIGTVEYMSFEQFNGQAEPRSDLYSLGATLYHALTGELPPKLALQPYRPLQEFVPTISDQTSKITAWLLHKAVAARPATATHLLQSLNSSHTPTLLLPTQKCHSCEATIRSGIRFCTACGVNLSRPPIKRTDENVPLKVGSEYLLAKIRKHHPFFEWSPDSSSIAYTDLVRGMVSLYVAKRTQHHSWENQLKANNLSKDTHFRWSANSVDVQTVSQSEYKKVNSFDGKKYAYLEIDSQKWATSKLFVVDNVTGQRNSLETHFPYYIKRILGWNSEGNILVCAVEPTTSIFSPTVYSIAIDVAQHELIDKGDIYTTYFSNMSSELRLTGMRSWWFGESDVLICSGIVKEKTSGTIAHILVSMKPFTKQFARLLQEDLQQTNSMEQVHYTETTRKIVYIRDSTQIWSVNIDGSGVQYLTEGFAPQWSPDGQHIAFLRSPKKDVYELRVLDVTSA